MIAELKAVSAALAYASFVDNDVKRTTEELLSKLNADLIEIGFEPSSTVEEARLALEESLNVADEPVNAASQTDDDDEDWEEDEDED